MEEKGVKSTIAAGLRTVQEATERSGVLVNQLLPLTKRRVGAVASSLMAGTEALERALQTDVDEPIRAAAEAEKREAPQFAKDAAVTESARACSYY